MTQKKFAVVFSSDMTRPLVIICDSLEEFHRKLFDVIMKYGEIELIYRIY